MLFKGMKFTKTKTVLPLPVALNFGEAKNYQMFGRIAAPTAPGSVATNYRWDSIPDGMPDAEPVTEEGVTQYRVWAVPVEPDGFSLTNLMYGKDGYMYLLLDGKVYLRRYRKNKPAPPALPERQEFTVSVPPLPEGVKPIPSEISEGASVGEVMAAIKGRIAWADMLFDWDSTSDEATAIRDAGRAFEAALNRVFARIDL